MQQSLPELEEDLPPYGHELTEEFLPAHSSSYQPQSVHEAFIENDFH